MAQTAESSGALNKIDRSDSTYSFGETDLTAERLRAVAEVFDPTSEAFTSETVRLTWGAVPVSQHDSCLLPNLFSLQAGWPALEFGVQFLFMLLMDNDMGEREDCGFDLASGFNARA
jgi:hypothetical protein